MIPTSPSGNFSFASPRKAASFLTDLCLNRCFLWRGLLERSAMRKAARSAVASAPANSAASRTSGVRICRAIEPRIRTCAPLSTTGVKTRKTSRTGSRSGESKPSAHAAQPTTTSGALRLINRACGTATPWPMPVPQCLAPEYRFGHPCRIEHGSLGGNSREAPIGLPDSVRLEIRDTESAFQNIGKRPGFLTARRVA